MTVRQFLYGLLGLAVLFMISGTTGDPDLWGHVRFGQDMLAHRGIRLPDTYSFTADRAWVNHEWATELAMAMAFNLFGAAGLNLLRIAVVACVLVVVWRASAMLSGRLRTVVFVVAAIGIYLRAHPIRPQVFSLLLFTLLLAILHRADVQRSLRPLVWVPLVMAVWVNLHGGWVVGLGYLVLWCVSRAATTTQNRARLAVLPAVALASTLVNPYGLEMWRFLAGTIRVERPMIGDWQPLFALPPLLWISWISALAVLVMAASSARSGVDWMNVAMAASLGAASMRVSRLDAFFALAAAFAVVSVFSNRVTEEAAPEPEGRSRALAVAFGACVVAAGIALMPRIVTVRVPDHLMPDANVAGYARDRQLKGDVLTWFDWGEYLIWHFGPDLKVSMDGRRETVYSAKLVDAHMRFYTGTSDEWRYADALNADYVWIPKRLPVVRELQRHGWRPLCEGKESILLARNDETPQCTHQATTSSRVFPHL